MIQRNRMAQVGTTIGHLTRVWEDRRRLEAAQQEPHVGQAFTITLAREAGTFGTLVAQEVGERLGWHVYDHELLDLIAEDMGLHAQLLKSVDERRSQWLSDTFEALMSVPHANPNAYVHRLVRTVLALGEHGECVIVGRGAAFILSPEKTLRVRLVAPVEDRIAALSRKLQVGRKEAARQLKDTDRERNNFVKDHFSKDPADPRHYDLTLRSGRWSVPDMAEVVINALSHLQAKKT
jgi:cytidylate kinase